MKYWLRTVFILSTLALAAPAALAQSDPDARLRAGLSAFDRHDFRAAWSLLEPLAEAGIARAQLTIGTMYARGDGALQDYVQAHSWLNLAASRGSGDARRLRDEIARRMTPQQIADAQNQARAFTPKRAPVSAPTAATVQPAEPAPAAGGLPSGSLTARIQKMLIELGYDPGPADGVAGRKTRVAIEQYQGHSGLTRDGQISQRLHDALAADLGYAGPPPSAPEAGTTVRRHGDTQPAGPAQRDDSRLGKAMEELRALIDRASRRQSASPRFLDRLRTLAGRYADEPAATPLRVLISDNFSDGDYQRSPRWVVRAGRFWVDDRSRLRSRVDPGSGTGPERSSDDLPTAILGAILGQDTRRRKATSAKALIELRAPVTAVFSLELVFDIGSGARHTLQLSLLGGAAATTGYHLTFDAGSDTTVRLVRSDGFRNTVLNEATLQAVPRSSRVHLGWSGDRRTMRVTLAGRTVLRTDEDSPGSYEGVALKNLAGSLGVDSIEIRGASD